MAGRLNKFFDKLYMGSEKSESFARASLPSNRWELFWDLLKSRFWKLVLLNLLVGLFLVPLYFLVYARYIVMGNFGSIYPFGQGLGVGYQAPVSLVGFKEGIAFNTNLFVYALLPIVGIIASVGISGGAYVIRNMVWSEGYFVISDFWKGVKQNFKQIFAIVVLYTVVLYSIILSTSLIEQYTSVGTSWDWAFIIAEIVLYFILAVYTLMTMHMIEFSVTYEYSFVQLFKNAYIFTIAMFPHSLILLAIGLLSFVPLFVGGDWFLLGLLTTLFLGFSFMMLIWTVFTQWAYDSFINPKMKNVKINRGIYAKYKGDDDENLQKYKMQKDVIVKTSLNSKPIKPITDDDLKLAELPEHFSREDIEKLNQSRKELYEDNQRYIEEHRKESKYEFTELDKKRDDERLAREKRIEQAKRELAKRDKKKR